MKHSEKVVSALAARLHAGQEDRQGRPYIEHLQAVHDILVARWPDATEAERQAAWLHDAIEDTAATDESLLAAGVLPEAVYIVRWLTKPGGADYLTWIADLCQYAGPSALRVKLADNLHNSDPSRAHPDQEGMEAKRYAPARRMLLEALREQLDPSVTHGAIGGA